MIVESLAAILAFLLSSWIAPTTETFLKKVGITGVDQHKKRKPVLPTSGGIIVAVGFLGSIFAIVALDTFLIDLGFNNLLMFAVTSTVLVITIIGLLDDMHVKDGKRIGLKQWQKPMLSFLAAVPMMVLAVGTTSMNFPIIGAVDFGALFPLVIVPLAVVFVSNAYNMLGGMNGLETGMGIVAFISLGIFSAINGKVESSVVSFAAAGASFAFILENWYPARILPGDSLTYLLGSIFVAIAVVGNIEKFATFLFLPWIAEFILKAKSKFQAKSLGKVKNGILKPEYKETYSLTHAVMKRGDFAEKDVTKILIGVEIIVSALAFGLYFLGIG